MLFPRMKTASVIILFLNIVDGILPVISISISNRAERSFVTASFISGCKVTHCFSIRTYKKRRITYTFSLTPACFIFFSGKSKNHHLPVTGNSASFPLLTLPVPAFSMSMLGVHPKLRLQ